MKSAAAAGRNAAAAAAVVVEVASKWIEAEGEVGPAEEEGLRKREELAKCGFSFKDNLTHLLLLLRRFSSQVGVGRVQIQRRCGRAL